MGHIKKTENDQKLSQFQTPPPPKCFLMRQVNSKKLRNVLLTPFLTKKTFHSFCHFFQGVKCLCFVSLVLSLLLQFAWAKIETKLTWKWNIGPLETWWYYFTQNVTGFLVGISVAVSFSSEKRRKCIKKEDKKWIQYSGKCFPYKIQKCRRELSAPFYDKKFIFHT